MKIYKYELELDLGAVQEIMMHQNSKILCLQSQGGKVCIWAEVDPYQYEDPSQFVFVGTGWDIPAKAEYVGTMQHPPFVFHLYRRKDG